jgi:ankyrin repeat protein
MQMACEYIGRLVVDVAHRSRFIWVNVWLDILLPLVYPIQGDDYAKKLLDELKQSSSGTVDGDSKAIQKSKEVDKLKVAYQRLWDIHSAGEFSDHQLRLFHLVLCSYMPVTTELATSALRISHRGKSSYNKQLTSAHIRHIYANFLFEDHNGNLQFAHSTARTFILNLETKEEGGSAGADTKRFSEERSRCSVATACFAIMKDYSHPAWGRARMIPDESAGRARHDIFSTPDHDGQHLRRGGSLNRFGPTRTLRKHRRRNSARDKDRPTLTLFTLQSQCLRQNPIAVKKGELLYCSPLLRGEPQFGKEDGFPFYVLFCWRRHFMDAYGTKSIFDVEWLNFVDALIISSQSALLRADLARHHFVLNGPSLSQTPDLLGSMQEDPQVFIRYDSNRLVLLHAHALAAFFSFTNIDFANVDFSNAELATFAQPTSASKSYNRLELLLQHSRTGNTYGASALHVACQNSNLGIVKLLLNGMRFLYGGPTALSLLFLQYKGAIPFEVALSKCQTPVIEALLRFEEEGTANGRSNSHSDSKSSLDDCQLAFKSSAGFTSLFFQALYLIDENVILLLLKYAKSTDYNSRDGQKNTAMHIAAKRGFVTVLENLLKHCDAGVNAENDKKETPLCWAAKASQLGAVEALLKCPEVEPAQKTAKHETALSIARTRLQNDGLRKQRDTYAKIVEALEAAQPDNANGVASRIA